MIAKSLLSKCLNQQFYKFCSAAKKGQISQVIGAVVDVQFEG